MLIIGLEDAAPHPSSPAWIRHCPHRDGSEEDRNCIPAIANFLFANMGRVSESEERRQPLTVGIHIGAYYCDQWAKEITNYSRCGGDAHRHVTEESSLAQDLRDILEGRDVPTTAF